jgi:hypothetical protein
MTITEKLNIVSELESNHFKSKVIESIIETTDSPDKLNRYNSVEDFWKHIDSENEVEG